MKEKRLIDMYLKRVGIDPETISSSDKEYLSIIYVKLLLVQHDLKRIPNDNYLYEYYLNEISELRKSLNKEVEKVRKKYN